MTQQSEQLKRPRQRSFSIPEVVDIALDGEIRVPNFQRNFVWDENDVRDFFDSIWRGFPIGTLLLWRNSAPKGLVEFGPISIAAEARTDALWVVDGQQRITSMVAVFNPHLRGDDRRFDIYFDLRRGRFSGRAGRDVPPTWLPLHQALDTRSLLSWLRDRAADLEPEDYDAADALGAAIREYQIPAYIVTSEDDYLLRKIFDRVNSAGKPIGRTEIFHALFASDTDPGSPDAVVESLDKRLRFGRIDSKRVLQSLLALRGGNVQRDVHEEFSADGVAADWYEWTEEGLARGIEFLRDQGIPHLSLTPSTLPLPVLAAFFHLHPEPEPWTRRLLARWLWRGWVHGFGNSGQTPALRQAIYQVNPKKGDSGKAPSEDRAALGLLATVPNQAVATLRLSPFKTESAVGKLAVLALASLHPRGPKGEPIDISAEFGEHGVAAVTGIVRARRSALGARGLWPIGAKLPTGHEDPAILMSHAINADAAKLLREQRIEDFVAMRGNAIEQLVSNFVNYRIEPRSADRPAISSLIVPEED